MSTLTVKRRLVRMLLLYYRLGVDLVRLVGEGVGRYKKQRV